MHTLFVCILVVQDVLRVTDLQERIPCMLIIAEPVTGSTDDRSTLMTCDFWQLALIVCGSATPWSLCPVERSGWTQNLGVFRQWLDAVQPSGGGPIPQPLLAGKQLYPDTHSVVRHYFGPSNCVCIQVVTDVSYSLRFVHGSWSAMTYSSVRAEALAEAVYLLQCPELSGTPDSPKKVANGHAVVCVASEPSRISVPWPFPADCKIAAGQASYTELCQVPDQSLRQSAFRILHQKSWKCVACLESTSAGRTAEQEASLCVLCRL